MQLNLFTKTKAPEEQTCHVVSRSVAPQWVFGRIDKKKGRQLWLLKQRPDAAVVSMTHPLVKQSGEQS
ncbi:hypothetical protein K3G39_19805 [Pontibacter sp. HSC-14F20]|uniref:hypothetical protein n=1 Tax=Pontibacter sp. HSC-14F20 TaxID=2864136 RepID=UPI001C73E017|nr:hypothetical protein [Pontibacter sp. HSC-14F20]MBX0335486.1 hypothetical protein [Pontibacter sp. HSC-14F20]